jgi:hypothetical protein
MPLRQWQILVRKIGHAEIQPHDLKIHTYSRVLSLLTATHERQHNFRPTVQQRIYPLPRHCVQEATKLNEQSIQLTAKNMALIE